MRSWWLDKIEERGRREREKRERERERERVHLFTLNYHLSKIICGLPCANIHSIVVEFIL